MKRGENTWGTGVIGLLSLALVCAAPAAGLAQGTADTLAARPDAPAGPDVGDPLPEATVLTSDGRKTGIRDLVAGKWLGLEFFRSADW